MFVMASDQTDNAVGQPQSGLWFGNIDDLWGFGKPTGWGGPWWEEQIEAGQKSDPFLMTGFDKKVIHLKHDSNGPVRFLIEIDFLGNGTYVQYNSIIVGPKGYRYHVFPDGFSAHWLRVTADRSCKASVYLFYN
jgi:hypothetical protein